MIPLRDLLAQGASIDADGAADAIQTEGLTATDWITAGVVLVAAFLLAGVVGKLFEKLLERMDSTPGVVLLLRRLVRYLIVIVGFVYALSAVGVRIGPLLGALGIAGIALAFALQDILENFVAGLLIQIRRPFVPGDQISSGDYEGTVHDINARTVVIDTPSGERVYLPAGVVIKDAIQNLTDKPHRRTSLDIGVEYDADLELAKTTLVDAAASCEGVLEAPAPEALVHEFGDSSIVIALRFWHEPRIASMWSARDAVAVAAKRALDDVGIAIPFPQSVVTFASRLDVAGDDQGSDSSVNG